MLKAYKFVQTDHQKLHGYVIAFFNRIEYETDKFSMDFFEADFKPIVEGHRKILKAAFKSIYGKMNGLDQAARSDLCDEIRQSNMIEGVCSRGVAARKFTDTDSDLYQEIRTLFKKLYSDVLDGKFVHERLKFTLRDHFDAFRKANADITLCPMCGIVELRTEYDDIRDQYDHYLPKDHYPLSAVNFFNLVPTCTDCNSIQIKGDTDVLAVTGKKIFYPYSENHKGVDVKFVIQKDDRDISKVELKVEFKSRDGKDEEVDAWKQIYKIEGRYVGFVKGRIEKWYRAYWEYIQDDDLKGMSDEQKKVAYLTSLKADETECLSLIRRPAFSTFLDSGGLERARIEAQQYG